MGWVRGFVGCVVGVLAAGGCAGTGSGGACTGSGCDSSMPVNGDGASGGPDSASVDLFGKVYVNSTIGAIDTGMVADGTLVSVANVVMTSPVSQRTATGGCTYRAWVQDATGNAPCGIDLFAFVPTSGACPAAPAPFAGRAQGDNVSFKGKLSISSYAGDGGTMLRQHSIAVDEITPTGGVAVVTPLMLGDPAQFTGYGPGFQAYEGMLISLGCTTGAACTTDGNKLKVKFQPGPYLWGVTGGALFGSGFASLWPGKPGATATAYTRITGVANTFLTGSLEPRGPTDFIP